jgi:hypothetical protein
LHDNKPSKSPEPVRQNTATPENTASVAVSPSKRVIPVNPPKTMNPYGQLEKGTGLMGEYYDNLDFTGFKFSRVDPVINFTWDKASPEPSVEKDIFSIRWTGQIVPLYSETYTFNTNTNDGVRLWINDKLIIDQWKVFYDGDAEYSGTIDLTAGKKYSIKLEYFEDINAATAKLLWSSKSQSKEIVPQSQLYPGHPPSPQNLAHGLKAMYFNDVDFNDLKITRVDSVVNFNWFTRAPIDQLGKDNFTVRWTGKIDSRYTEDYTFHTVVDGGVRLWVNGVLIIDHWEADPKKRDKEWSGVVFMKAGVRYDIKMEYFDNGNGATAKLLWSSKRQAKRIVSSDHLYPD